MKAALVKHRLTSSYLIAAQLGLALAISPIRTNPYGECRCPVQLTYCSNQQLI